MLMIILMIGAVGGACDGQAGAAVLHLEVNALTDAYTLMPNANAKRYR
jgi:hypothetical protein